jgi:hypothetical protein
MTNKIIVILKLTDGRNARFNLGAFDCVPRIGEPVPIAGFLSLPVSDVSWVPDPVAPNFRGVSAYIAQVIIKVDYDFRLDNPALVQAGWVSETELKFH